METPNYISRNLRGPDNPRYIGTESSFMCVCMHTHVCVVYVCILVLDSSCFLTIREWWHVGFISVRSVRFTANCWEGSLSNFALDPYQILAKVHPSQDTRCERHWLYLTHIARGNDYGVTDHLVLSLSSMGKPETGFTSTHGWPDKWCLSLSLFYLFHGFVFV